MNAYIKHLFLVFSLLLIFPSISHADNLSKYFVIKSVKNNLCVDNAGWTNKKVVAWVCKEDVSNNLNQQWFFDVSAGKAQIVSASDHRYCMEVNSNHEVVLNTCDLSVEGQQWEVTSLQESAKMSIINFGTTLFMRYAPKGDGITVGAYSNLDEVEFNLLILKNANNIDEIFHK